MEISLVDDWEFQNRQGPKNRPIINNYSDKLHGLGRVSWARGYTLGGYPS